jgi:hypothetical protein
VVLITKMLSVALLSSTKPAWNLDKILLFINQSLNLPAKMPEYILHRTTVNYINLLPPLIQSPYFCSIHHSRLTHHLIHIPHITEDIISRISSWLFQTEQWTFFKTSQVLLSVTVQLRTAVCFITLAQTDTRIIHSLQVWQEPPHTPCVSLGTTIRTTLWDRLHHSQKLK